MASKGTASLKIIVGSCTFIFQNDEYIESSSDLFRIRTERVDKITKRGGALVFGKGLTG